MDRPLRLGEGIANRDNIGNRIDRDNIGNRIDRDNIGNRIDRDNIGNRIDRDNIGNRIDRTGIDSRINRTDIDNRIGDNIGNRIDTNIGNRMNTAINRPINIGEINMGNRVINSRSSWVNIDNNRLNTINNRWQSQIGGLGNWATLHPRRTAYWNGWADGVRSQWGGYRNYGWFNNNWWNNHPHAFCGWHYGYWFNRYPARYWWSVPTFASVTNWFSWSAPQAVWSEPVYYDYGTGGNVVYSDNSVSINNQPVATAEEFAQSAAALATVEPPATEEAAAEAEWMPLGTFAVSANEKDVNPTRVAQLAVNRQGVISGTLYNTETDEAQTIQGQVDKNTQRVAFRIGESETVVAESGLYNLTQQEAPLLVHFGTDKVENYLLVRLEQPEEETPNATQ